MNTVSSLKEEIKTLEVTSPAFIHLSYIPQKYTCDGENINPELVINKIPKETKSLLLIVEDPDAPVRTWTHWLVWNIRPGKKIKENYIPGTEGMTDFRTQGYNGPCPPKSELHHYHFKIYALNDLIDLNPRVTKHEVEKLIGDHILAFGELIGLYQH